ncbi:MULTISPECIES: pilus assembly protein PilJ [unclassified Acinetobacter]|uniref:pilus assembly protein PilJ n=2 Tax=unclassified Acinetobacter TaxID=196816 RepID=UPI0015D2F0A0|nr:MULTISPECIES: pilus assembly protein PilJ [unclassified Acinetobacter]UUS60238.1 pilus assembly protein PilJ [Acinetobacter sp. YH16056_T]
MNNSKKLSKIKQENNKMLRAKSIIRPFFGIALALMLSACSTLATDHHFCELKVLSLQIPKQTEGFIRFALPGAVDGFKHNQQKFNQALTAVHKKYANRDGADKMLQDGQAINANIDLLVQHQNSLSALYEYQLLVSETIPGIQAEYNILADMMARANNSAIQAMIAKNQVYIAGRMLSSLLKLTDVNSIHPDDLDDFLADFETFNIFLKAQLNGNPELGVERVNNAEMRESLLSIQAETEEMMKSETMALLKQREPLLSVINAARDNVAKSEEIFARLSEFESSQ